MQAHFHKLESYSRHTVHRVRMCPVIDAASLPPFPPWYFIAWPRFWLTLSPGSRYPLVGTYSCRCLYFLKPSLSSRMTESSELGRELRSLEVGLWRGGLGICWVQSNTSWSLGLPAGRSKSLGEQWQQVQGTRERTNGNSQWRLTPEGRRLSELLQGPSWRWSQRGWEAERQHHMVRIGTSTGACWAGVKLVRLLGEMSADSGTGWANWRKPTRQ